MLRTLLFFIVPLLCFSFIAQEENALPPGPSKFSGKVVDANGKPIEKAKITVLYADGVQRNADNYYTNEWGYFTAYITRYGQKHIDIQISINDSVCKTIRQENPGRGRNLSMNRREYICENE